MSSNDKTRQKLMESMRKTKAGTGKKSVEAEEKDKSQAKKDKAVKAKSKKAQKKVARKSDVESTRDPYQSSRRVWPD